MLPEISKESAKLSSPQKAHCREAEIRSNYGRQQDRPFACKEEADIVHSSSLTDQGPLSTRSRHPGDAFDFDSLQTLAHRLLCAQGGRPRRACRHP